MAHLDLIGDSAKFRTQQCRYGCAGRFGRPDSGRDRDRQGSGCPGDSRGQPSAQESLRRTQLRGDTECPTGDELFGCEKGAFTGAVTQTVGRFQAADRGTLFLDEIGDLPLELQPKLLRVLQEKQFERLGGSHTLRADVRIVAATIC